MPVGFQFGGYQYVDPARKDHVRQSWLCRQEEYFLSIISMGTKVVLIGRPTGPM
jgi:hypothetical protein